MDIFDIFLCMCIYIRSPELMADHAHSIIIGLLLVALFMLVADKFRCAKHRKAAGPEIKITREYECSDGSGNSADVSVTNTAAGAGDLETAHKKSINENVEYFETCAAAADETAKALDCACDPSTGFPFAKNAYGAPGLDYNTFVMSQGVDSQVLENHASFVKDRKNVNSQGGEFTGRTWTPQGEIEGGSYSKNWWGIRGPPMAVPVCNPTQQNEIDPDAYRYKRICF